MKKLLYLFSAVALTLTSCSDEDDTNNNSSNVTLIKKIILTSDDEEDDSYWNNTITFTYNGTKLVEAREDDNYKTVYTYTGDLITKEEFFVDDIIGKQVFIEAGEHQSSFTPQEKNIKTSWL